MSEEVRKNSNSSLLSGKIMMDEFLEGNEDKKIIWSILRRLKSEFSEILIMKHIETSVAAMNAEKSTKVYEKFLIK